MNSSIAYQESLELREAIRGVTTLLSVANCPYGYRRTDRGVVENGCSNAHACPVCTRRMLAEKRSRFISIAASLENLGFIAWHVTLTVSHASPSPSERYANLLKKVWRRFSTSQIFKRIRASANFGGYVRVLEETISMDGQLNPHIHLVVFWAGDGLGLSDLIEAWVASSDQIPDVYATHSSQSLEQVESYEGLAWYLFKHMYIDVRQPRRPLGYVNRPIDVLREYGATRNLDALAMWFVFETSANYWKRVIFRIIPAVS
jgi:hypothetical protein